MAEKQEKHFVNLYQSALNAEARRTQRAAEKNLGYKLLRAFLKNLGLRVYHLRPVAVLRKLSSDSHFPDCCGGSATQLRFIFRKTLSGPLRPLCLCV